MSQSIGVLLMAYGTPRNLAEVEPYYLSIRGGRQPTPEEVQNLTERYRRVGGKTPLLEITEEVASTLERRLNSHLTSRYRVYVGMKHWHPFIAEAVRRIAEEGVESLIALPLAPHFSEMSIGGYRSTVEEAVSSLPRHLPVRFIESWHANSLFIQAVVEKIQKALRGFRSGDAGEVEVIFSAHSLPRRIQQWGDPYQEELRQSCDAVARAAGLASWRFTFQSAGHTKEPWLGPDILETLGLGDFHGRKQVLIVPIGFVSDNLEILYDLDVEARELAEGLGLRLRRTEMLNADPAFIEALAEIVTNGTGARIADLPRKERVP